MPIYLSPPACHFPPIEKPTSKQVRRTYLSAPAPSPLPESLSPDFHEFAPLAFALPPYEKSSPLQSFRANHPPHNSTQSEPRAIPC